jgi:ribosomal protein S6
MKKEKKKLAKEINKKSLAQWFMSHLGSLKE